MKNVKSIMRKISLIVVFAIVFTSIFPDSILAARKNNYVKSLSVSQKTITIRTGQTKTLSYKIRIKGKANKKVAVKASNANIKVSVNKGKIKVLAKKSGTSKIIVTSKGKNKKGKKLKKTILVKVLGSGRSDNNPIFKTPLKTVRPSATLPVYSRQPDKPYGYIEVTKSEWVAAVMKATEYEVQRELFTFDENKNICYSFTDISEDANANIIETAAKYGILPDAGGEFHPNDAANREFLAVTSVRAVGLAMEDQEINFYDKSALKYEQEDAAAIQLKLLQLAENRFVPEQAITKQERQNAVKILSDIMDNRKVDEKHKDVIKYDENVVSPKDITEYDVSEKNGIYTVVVPIGTSLDGIAADGRIILPPSDGYTEGVALHVESNTLASDGAHRIIKGTMPNAIAEFVDTVDIQGKATPYAEEITAVDGVATVEVSTHEEANVNELKSVNKLSAKIDGDIELKDLTRISYNVRELGTTVSFYISKLTYSVDFNKKGVNKIYIGLPNVLSVNTDYKASKSFSKKIGDIPIKLAAGFSANIEVYLEAAIGGEITLDLKLSNNIGMQYYNGQFWVEKSCEPAFDAEVDADVEAGAKLQMSLYWMEGIKKIFGKKDSRPVYSIHTSWGLHGDATLHIRNDQYTSYKNLACVDFGYYLYGRIGVGNDSVLGDKFGLIKSWDIYDSENSPLKGDMHLENGKVVQKCTYNNTDNILSDYVSQYSFLCDDTTFHDVYAQKKGDLEIGTKTDIQKKPFTYDISDFDSDGTNELLIADTEARLDYNNETYLVIKLKMYEVENGIVKLRAEEGCQTFVGEFPIEIPVYETIGQGGTKLYKYLQNNEIIIAVENKAVSSVFADGVGFVFNAVKYDGQKFIKIGYESFGGSSWEEEEIQNYNKFFASIGLNVDTEQIVLADDKCVIDFIANPIVMGRSYNTMVVDYTIMETMYENPNVYYKISQVRFSRN